MGLSITSTLAVTLLFLQNPAALIQKNCQKTEIAKAEFKRLESTGIIQRSNSPWASPLHMLPKKDGSWQSCGDNSRLNLITTPDKYSLPNMQDVSNGLHGLTVFSKIDLSKATAKSLLRPQTFQKRRLSRHLASLSAFSCLLNFPTHNGLHFGQSQRYISIHG
jgi:hypothetical protein